jgi:hypothetical protein
MSKKYFLILIGFLPLKSFAQEQKSDSSWNFEAWFEMYFIPHGKDIFNPTFYARHKTLHLEGRYNYEDKNTASIWAGYSFKFGHAVKFELVPMGGVVFGHTNSIAPGLETDMTYKIFDFYSESEYVTDFSAKENNFFYMYSEVAVQPIKWLRTGVMTQRTRLFKSPRELQRGIFGEYYFGRFRSGVFYFSPFASDQFWIGSFSVDF